MIYTDLTKKAMKLCFAAHKEQTDKTGIPYVFHPIHLAEQMKDELTTVTALLHDVVEDSDYTLSDLEAMGFPKAVLDALTLLTHDPSVPYLDYVALIKTNPIARAVKLADLRHNSDLSRLDQVDGKALQRVEKYAAALAMLDPHARLETKDLILRKPDFADWQDLYRNLWSREESARFMFWEVTRSEANAKDRMRRTIRYQATRPVWVVYEKARGCAIGFAGMVETSPGVYEDAGIALGPEFTGKGYGKQILNALTDHAFGALRASRFLCACRTENIPSRRMILGCGFRYTHTEQKTDPRNGEVCHLEYFEKISTT